MISYNPKLFRITCWIGVLLPIYVIFVDLPLLKVEDHTLYIAGRLLTALSTFLIILDSYLKMRSWHVPLAFIILISYSIHGQFFLPCYYLAYMEVVLAFGLFFPMRRKVFLSILIIGCLAMILTVFKSTASYSDNLEVTNKFKFDAFMGVFVVSLLAYFGNTFVIEQRMNKEKILNQFFEVGKHTSMIIHDLKGRIFAPYNYSLMLNKEIQKKNEPLSEFTRIAEKLNEEIKSLKKYVIEINQLPGLNNSVDKISVSAIVESIVILYKSKLKNLAVVVDGDLEVYTKSSLLKVIIANLLINAAENAHEKEVLEPKVNINIRGNVVKIHDNGGGFNQKTLNKLNNQEIVSEKINGSGLGLMIVRDYMSEILGTVKFYNEKDGAVVELVFKDEVKNEAKFVAS